MVNTFLVKSGIFCLYFFLNGEFFSDLNTVGLLHTVTVSVVFICISHQLYLKNYVSLELPFLPLMTVLPTIQHRSLRLEVKRSLMKTFHLYLGAPNLSLSLPHFIYVLLITICKKKCLSLAIVECCSALWVEQYAISVHFIVIFFSRTSIISFSLGP